MGRAKGRALYIATPYYQWQTNFQHDCSLTNIRTCTSMYLLPFICTHGHYYACIQCLDDNKVIFRVHIDIHVHSYHQATLQVSVTSAHYVFIYIVHLSDPSTHSHRVHHVLPMQLSPDLHILRMTVRLKHFTSQISSLLQSTVIVHEIQ